MAISFSEYNFSFAYIFNFIFGIKFSKLHLLYHLNVLTYEHQCGDGNKTFTTLLISLNFVYLLWE